MLIVAIKHETQITAEDDKDKNGISCILVDFFSADGASVKLRGSTKSWLFIKKGT